MKRLSEILHDNPWGVVLINVRRIIRQRIMVRRYDDKTAIERMYFSRLGRQLDLKKPERFTEKLQWLKLYHRDPLMTVCADKIAIRDYLTQLGYKQYLMPIVGTYRKVSDINASILPDKCILKASHGSSMHLVKKGYMKQLPLSWKCIMYTWMHMNIYVEGREWPYKDVPPGIICEEFVEAKTDNKLKDYKFFCFSGEPEMIQVDSDLLDNHRIDFFNMQWDRLPLKCQYQNSNKDIPKPINFDMMCDIARNLSKPFPHVRIDFYEFDEEMRIGEMTFFDGSGFYSFNPDHFDYDLGQKLILPSR